MKRTLVALTDGELGTLRAAILTAQEEDCGRAVWNRLARLLEKAEASPVIDRRDWKAFEDAAGEILTVGDEPNDHVNVKACRRFSKALGRIFGTTTNF